MKIECLIHRKNGSSAKLDGVTYEWNAENDNTCEVEDEAHANRILAVPGFRAAEGEEAEAKPAAAKPAAAPRGKGKGAKVAPVTDPVVPPVADPVAPPTGEDFLK